MSQDESQIPCSVAPEAGEALAGPHGLPSSWLVRGTWLFAGVILPVICFLISYPEGPNWQSGEWSAYAQLLLARNPSLAQYPFLLYCMTCMVLLIFRPTRFANNTFVRLGIFAGVVVAAEYWVVFQVACEGTHPAVSVALSAFAVVVPWGVGWLIELLVRKVGYERVLGLGLLVGLPLLFFFFAVPMFICLWCSTPWALAVYLAASAHLIRGSGATRLRFSLAQLLLVFAWLSAHLAAWRISVLVMLQEYAALPTTPPSSCFICTAVAHGHPRVVRSSVYLDANGAAHRANDQLRYLKAFELLLAISSPRLHRGCRWIYDRIGPRLAAAIVHPVLADLGYLLLKPAEWLARGCLAVAIPGRLGVVRDLYRITSRS